MAEGILCDTSFFIRLLDSTDPLHPNARGYFRYLLERQSPLFISTVSVAEYCVVGSLDGLPLRNLQMLPFNLNHARRTGELARLVFDEKKKLRLRERHLIPSDSKLLAQADSEGQIGYYLTSDAESEKIYRLLAQKTGGLHFQFLNLQRPHGEAFGVFDF